MLTVSLRNPRGDGANRLAYSCFMTDATPQALVRSQIALESFRLTPGGDAREIHIALAWRPSARTEFELRARLESGGAGRGTFMRNGVSHPVRCEMERMEE